MFIYNSSEVFFPAQFVWITKFRPNQTSIEMLFKLNVDGFAVDVSLPETKVKLKLKE
jgi:hypothetical protein